MTQCTVIPTPAMVSKQFQDAISIIDSIFGPEYARKNPALLAVVLNAFAPKTVTA